MIFDKERFEIFASSFRKQNSTKIETLSKKRLHPVLKILLDDEAKHEVKLGPYFLDIFNDEIIEIQTRSMNKLRNKLLIYFVHLKYYFSFLTILELLIYFLQEEVIIVN